jgi:hypothetical protein
MKISLEAKTVTLLLTCFFAAVFLSYFWHSLPVNAIDNPGIALIEYPKVTYADTEDCVVLEFLFPLDNTKNSFDLSAKAANVLFSATEQVKYGQTSLQKKYCFSTNKREVQLMFARKGAIDVCTIS